MYGVTIMNKRYFILMKQIPSQSFFALIITAVFFITGCIIGTISAGLVKGLPGISGYLSNIISILMSDDGSSLSFLSVLIDTMFYHLIIFALGFCVFGFVFIPVVAGVRGCIFAFSISVLIRYYGQTGIFPAFLLFGLKSLIATPCLLFLAVQSFCASVRLTSIAALGINNGDKPYDSGFVMRCAVCFAVLLILSAISFFASDSIFGFISNII